MAVVKPQTPIINWDNPITKGLVICLPCYEGAGPKTRNLGLYGSNCDAVFEGSPTWCASKSGVGIKFSATSDHLNLGTKISTTISQNTTFLTYWKKTDSTNRISAQFYTLYGSTDSDRFGFHCPWNDGNAYWQFGGSSGNNSLSFSGGSFTNDSIMVGTIGPRGSEIWQNAVLKASNGAATSITRTTANAINFKINNNPDTSVGDLAIFQTLYLWDRQLNATEIRSISVNPFQIYRQPRFNIFNSITSSATYPGYYAHGWY